MAMFVFIICYCNAYIWLKTILYLCFYTDSSYIIAEKVLKDMLKRVGDLTLKNYLDKRINEMEERFQISQSNIQKEKQKFKGLFGFLVN